MTNKQKIRLCIISGGASPEHEVSLKSAKSISSAVDKEKYEIIPVFIDKNGRWDLSIESLKDKIDIAFPVLHGTGGEDGTIQGLFELLSIPYVGAGVEASAIGMDKVIAKDIFKQHNIPVADYRAFLKKEIKSNPQKVISRVIEEIGFPCFVKPSNAGSSIGISKVKSKSDLTEAFEIASRYDRKILVEKGLNVRELEISVLGNDDPVTSAIGEILPADEFYSFEAKYYNSDSKTILPASISKKEKERISDLAIKAYKSIDCAGMARADFFLTKDTGEIYINEVNTIPGFTNISMYPKLWEHSGLPVSSLIDRLIELGFERFQEKNEINQSLKS